VVHYVSYGTPGGEYGKECRAAIITEAKADLGMTDRVGLAVLNPSGLFFDPGVVYHAGGETAGTPGCPDAASHGNPMRYCACGWTEAAYAGGTWHWPERTGDQAPPVTVSFSGAGPLSEQMIAGIRDIVAAELRKHGGHELGARPPRY
jgi:hypothetical protein